MCTEFSSCFSTTGGLDGQVRAAPFRQVAHLLDDVVAAGEW
jgi:hypothetical protein